MDHPKVWAFKMNVLRLCIALVLCMQCSAAKMDGTIVHDLSNCSINAPIRDQNVSCAYYFPKQHGFKWISLNKIIMLETLSIFNGKVP